MPLGTLYVVATPLGNLGDLSPRAAETLRAVHTVAAEDTRHTQKLLHAIEAHPRLVSYHAHSGAERADGVLDVLRAGHDVALVTDAGTPAVSDPGAALVSLARVAGVRVVPVAGPSAAAAALSASGLSADRYVFLGFLPRKGTGRRRLLERIAGEPWSIVLYEAANRLDDLLADLAGVCGADREACVARELTKLHEDVRSGTLASLRTYYEENPPLGEITVVVRGAPDQPAESIDPDEVARAIAERLEAGDSRKDVVSMVTARFGMSRNEAYRLVTER